MGEHKLVPVQQILGIGKWKKQVLAIQNVAKTGNIGKKLQRQAISIMYVTSACRRLT